MIFCRDFQIQLIDFAFLKKEIFQDLENLRDDLESTHKTELDLLRKEIDEKYTNEMHSKLKEKESDFKRTMETYQTIIHKLESKVRVNLLFLVKHQEA